MHEGERILNVNLDEQMKTAYIDYSMSVIVSRALPDVRDGFKPVHRRVLFGMLDLGVTSGKPYKKSARIVGEVLGKYHPHGDTSVYDTMVRMAQEWSLRYTMVEGQGNYGSIDGDPPAAMRYTEARLQKIADEMLADINKDTVDFQLNFDDSLEEPTVLPAKVPNLIINGSSGIAVGMATNMAPHNITEAIKATLAYIDNREITIDELMEYIKAPDFPTGGIIYGYEGVKEAMRTGRGRIVLRAKTEIETDKNGRERIVVTEVPYQVNKAMMLERTSELINEKKIEGISSIKDLSNREGIRVEYEIKRDSNASVVLNNLFKYTALQTSFSVNNIALVKGRPLQLNIKDLIVYFVEHRHDVVVRRTKFELREAEKRAHILEGFMIVLDKKEITDEVIKLIRNAETPEAAHTGLMETYGLSDIQTTAILALTLRRLTGLEIDKIRAEYAEIMALINRLKEILGSEVLQFDIIKRELAEVLEKFGDERRTSIEYAAGEINMEDIIEDESVIITISNAGYIKRTATSEYRSQSRGGKGAMASQSRDDDFIEHIVNATAHNYMLFFTEMGKCYWLKVYNIPEGTRTSKGRAIQNLINIDKDDKIRTFINVKNLKDQEYLDNNYVILCTKKGIIKKTSLDAYSNVRANGVNAITVRDGDTLLEARLTSGNSEIIMAKKSGKANRFNESKVRPMGRTASGVRGVELEDANDEVIGMITIDDKEHTILVVSQNGYGKRTDIEDYRITNRGGKGVKTINVTDKTGALIAIKDVLDTDDLMIICQSGIAIRQPVEALRVMGRATQGVKLINIKDGDVIAGITKLPREEELDETDYTATEGGIEGDTEGNVDGDANITPEV